MTARYVYGVAALLAFAAAYACWCHAPLIWDGAYQFNATLIMQRPYFYLTRFHTWFLWWPTVWASRVTSNVSALQTVYGLPFLLAPVVGVLLSWWMVREHAPRLILWAVFGIAAAALPGQIFVINDSIFQQHIFWPIFMAIFVPLSWPKKIVLALLIPFQFVHPLGVLLLGGATGAALAMAWSDRANRRTMLIRAAILGGLCLLAISKIIITNHIRALDDTYARDEARWQTALDRWYAGVMGWPIRGLWMMWGAGIMALLYRLPRGAIRWPAIAIGAAALAVAGALLSRAYRVHPAEMFAPGAVFALIYLCLLLVANRPNLAALAATAILLGLAFFSLRRFWMHPNGVVAYRIGVAACAVCVLFLLQLRRTIDPAHFAGCLVYLCAAVGAVFWIRWAADDRLWWKALDYRRWLGPLTAPFFALATLEACAMARGHSETDLASPEETRPLRGKLALILATTFAIVLGVQSTIWQHRSRRLIAAVERSPGAIVPVTAFPWIAGACLDHWGSGDYVTVMQGKTPHKLLMFSQQSIDDLYATPPKFPHWDMYPGARPDHPDQTPGAAGWFDFRPFLRELANHPRPTMRLIPDRLDSKSTPN